MALNNIGCGALIIIFFLFLTVSKGQETNNTSSPPVASNNNETQKRSLECPAKHIEDQMESTAAKCKEFAEKEIKRRMENPKIVEDDMKCLVSCYGGYMAAAGYITKGIADVSAGLYMPAAQDCIRFITATAPCTLCSAKLALSDPEFWGFQKWARQSAEDLNHKLISCAAQKLHH